MYEKDKRSFFERLTGTINVDEQESPDRHSEEVDDSGLADEEYVGSEDTEIQEHEYEEAEDQHMIHNELTVEEEKEPEEEVGELGVDIFEEDNKIIIQAMIAGVRPDDIDISITRREVKLRGTRRIIRPIPNEDYYHKELYWGGFAREIKLPEEIDPEGAEAIEEHGLLELRLPKVDKSETQQIKVKAI